MKHPGDDSLTPPDKTKTRLESPDKIKIDQSIGGSIDLNYPGLDSITPPDNTGVNLGTMSIPRNNSGWDVFSPPYLPPADFPDMFSSMSIMGEHPAERAFMPSSMGSFSPSTELGTDNSLLKTSTGPAGAQSSGSGSPGLGNGFMPQEGGQGGLLGGLFTLPGMGGEQGGGQNGGLPGMLGLGGGGEENNPFQGILDSMDLVIGKNDDLLGSFQKSMGGNRGPWRKGRRYACRFVLQVTPRGLNSFCTFCTICIKCAGFFHLKAIEYVKR